MSEKRIGSLASELRVRDLDSTSGDDWRNSTRGELVVYHRFAPSRIALPRTNTLDAHFSGTLVAAELLICLTFDNRNCRK